MNSSFTSWHQQICQCQLVKQMCIYKLALTNLLMPACKCTCKDRNQNENWKWEMKNENSPGHQPSGVLDNEKDFWIVPPIVPHWSPGARRTHPSMMVMPPFFDFLATQKIIKNPPFQKQRFLAIFRDLQGFPRHFLSVLDSFWVPVGAISSMIFRHSILDSFFHIFSGKT